MLQRAALLALLAAGASVAAASLRRGVFAAEFEPPAVSGTLPRHFLQPIKSSNATHTVFADLNFTFCNTSGSARFPRGPSANAGPLAPLGKDIRLMCFGGRTPAPLLEMSPGKTFSLAFDNKLPPDHPDPSPPFKGACWPPQGVDKKLLPTTATPIGYPNNPHWGRTVNIHTHGLQTSPYDDDKFVELHPGETWQYAWRIPVDHPPGILWFHSHMMGSVHTHASNAASGLLIVRGELDDFMRAAGAAEVAIILQSLELNKLPDEPTTLGNDPLPYKCPIDGGYSANAFVLEAILVNGVPVATSDNGAPFKAVGVPPTVTAPAGSLLFLRFANGSPRTIYSIGFVSQSGAAVAPPADVFVVEVDGVSLKSPLRFVGGPPFAPNVDSSTGYLLPPAARVSFLVRVPAEGRSVTIGHTSLNEAFNPTGGFGFFKISGTAPTGAPPPMPTTLPGPTARNRPLLDSEVVKRRSFALFISGFPGSPPPNPFLLSPFGYYLGIDGAPGRPFAEMRVDVVMLLGTVEEWRISNPTSVAHGWHVHINSFEVVAILDAKGKNTLVPDGITFIADTVYICAGCTAVTRMRFVDWVGPFVAHCHILSHEEQGMMINVRVDGMCAAANPPRPAPHPLIASKPRLLTRSQQQLGRAVFRRADRGWHGLDGGASQRQAPCAGALLGRRRRGRRRRGLGRRGDAVARQRERKRQVALAAAARVSVCRRCGGRPPRGRSPRPRRPALRARKFWRGPSGPARAGAGRREAGGGRRAGAHRIS